MGGSGPPPDGDRRRREEPPHDEFPSCEAIRFETALASPSRDVVATLQVGQVLLLRLGTQQNRPVVDAVTEAGERAGSIVSNYLTQLIDCLQRGHEYQADIRDLNGGACRVLVYHKSR